MRNICTSIASSASSSFIAGDRGNSISINRNDCASGLFQIALKIIFNFAFFSKIFRSREIREVLEKSIR